MDKLSWSRAHANLFAATVRPSISCAAEFFLLVFHALHRIVLLVMKHMTNSHFDHKSPSRACRKALLDTLGFNTWMNARTSNATERFVADNLSQSPSMLFFPSPWQHVVMHDMTWKMRKDAN